MKEKNYIFGYGSLVNIEQLKKYLHKEDVFYTYTHLNNHQRVWNIAMDNSNTIQNYKYYLNNNKERENIFVTFLNIQKNRKSHINGILFEVDQTDLTKLDQRERNYNRINVTQDIQNKNIPGKIWTYIGTREAEERFQTGKKQQKSYINQNYINFVHESYKALGKDYFQDFLNSTKAQNLPQKELTLIKT